MKATAPVEFVEEAGTCRTIYIDEERVAEAQAAIPGEEEIAHIADAFGVLSDPTRLRILIALSTGELCVCDLSKVIGRSMPATSHQLQLLRRAALVKYRMAGKLAYYRLADVSTKALLHDALGKSANRAERDR